jgi:DNA-binding transcriptional LysR family regulator
MPPSPGDFSLNVSLTMLRTFARVVDAGSISAAARTLFIAQSAVSAHIAALTRLSGTPLLERVNGRWEATAAGEILCRRAKDISLVLDAAGRDMAAAASGVRGHFTLAATPAVAHTILAEILLNFDAHHADVRVDVKVASRDEALQWLTLGSADMMLTPMIEPTAGISVSPFAKDELVIAVPRNHRLCSRGDVDVDELAGESFVGYHVSSGVPAFLRERLGPVAVSFKHQLAINSNDAILTCVESGVGIAFVPERIAERWERAGLASILRIRGVDLKRDLVVALRDDFVPSHAARAFVDWLSTAYSEAQARTKIA